MPVRTKRWNDPAARADGVRLLIARYRPRGVATGDEAWDVWEKRLAPSPTLLDAFYGKRREGRRVVARGLPPIAWDRYVERFRDEMQAPAAREALRELRAGQRAGRTVTLLCYCADESRCHRTVLRGLVVGR